jgi:hypothetical protein
VYNAKQQNGLASLPVKVRKQAANAPLLVNKPRIDSSTGITMEGEAAAQSATCTTRTHETHTDKSRQDAHAPTKHTPTKEK